MKSYLAALTSFLLALPLLGREPAQVTLYCNSLRLEAATRGFGQDDKLELTSDPNLSEIDGELAPLFDSNAPSHGSSYDLEETDTLSQNSWSRVSLITVTNDPQTLALPLSSSPTRFWRARVP